MLKKTYDAIRTRLLLTRNVFDKRSTLSADLEPIVEVSQQVHNMSPHQRLSVPIAAWEARTGRKIETEFTDLIPGTEKYPDEVCNVPFTKLNVPNWSMFLGSREYRKYRIEQANKEVLERKSTLPSMDVEVKVDSIND